MEGFTAGSSGGRPPPGVKPEFVVSATSEVCKRFGDGELAAAKAMVTRKVTFPRTDGRTHGACVLAADRHADGQAEGTGWRT